MIKAPGLVDPLDIGAFCGAQAHARAVAHPVMRDREAPIRSLSEAVATGRIDFPWRDPGFPGRSFIWIQTPGGAGTVTLFDDAAGWDPIALPIISYPN